MLSMLQKGNAFVNCPSKFDKSGFTYQDGETHPDNLRKAFWLGVLLHHKKTNFVLIIKNKLS
jgi:hypothetical protein